MHIVNVILFIARYLALTRRYIIKVVINTQIGLANLNSPNKNFEAIKMNTQPNNINPTLFLNMFHVCTPVFIANSRFSLCLFVRKISSVSLNSLKLICVVGLINSFFSSSVSSAAFLLFLFIKRVDNLTITTRISRYTMNGMPKTWIKKIMILKGNATTFLAEQPVNITETRIKRKRGVIYFPIAPLIRGDTKRLFFTNDFCSGG
jgi:hypothetical protein